MAEYKLSYTGSEIDAKLGKIDNLEGEVGELSEAIESRATPIVSLHQVVSQYTASFMILSAGKTPPQVSYTLLRKPPNAMAKPPSQQGRAIAKVFFQESSPTNLRK